MEDSLLRDVFIAISINILTSVYLEEKVKKEYLLMTLISLTLMSGHGKDCS